MKHLLHSLAASAVICTTASAASIAMNFAENAANQVFDGGQAIGPTALNSTFWNSSIDFDTGSLATGEIGSVSTLIDSTGAATTAKVSWSSNNVWFNGDGTATDQAKLAVGYLDDSTGVTVTLTDIPYAQYWAIVMFTSDQGAEYQHGPMTVNGSGILGGGNFNAFGSINPNGWVLADGTTSGNFAIITDLTDPILTITSARDGDARGPITGVIVVEGVPEPSVAVLLGLGSLALFGRRRK